MYFDNLTIIRSKLTIKLLILKDFAQIILRLKPLKSDYYAAQEGNLASE
jgi:hypothetical protein